MKNPDKSKCDWDGWVLNGGKYEIANSYCFACEYDCKYSGDDDTKLEFFEGLERIKARPER